MDRITLSQCERGEREREREKTKNSRRKAPGERERRECGWTRLYFEETKTTALSRAKVRGASENEKDDNEEEGGR